MRPANNGNEFMTAFKDTLPASPSTRIEKVVARCGVEAWLVEDYTVPLVAIDFAFTNGASSEPADKSGLAYLLTGLLDEGAGPYDSQAFQERLEEHAVELTFDASRDRVNCSVRTLRQHLDLAVDMVGLALNEPHFEAKAIRRVKGQILAQLKQEENEPNNIAGRTLARIGYPDHPYRHHPHGTPETLAKVTRADLVKAHKALLARSTLKISVVGAISAPKLADVLDQLFASLPEKPAVLEIPYQEIQGLGQIAISDLDIPQSTLLYARPSLTRQDPDFMGAFLVNHVLGGGSFTSRLWQEVREKRGLAYSVWSNMSGGLRSSTFYIGTATSNERMAESLKIIQDEVKRMAQEGPSAEELAKAQKYQIGSYALKFDTSAKIARMLGELQIEGLDTNYISDRNAIVAAVTLEDARRAAQRLLGDGQGLVSIAGRPEGITSTAN